MKWKNINDNFGRRTEGDRRKKRSAGIKEERRSGSERRKIPDRRSNVERRKKEATKGDDSGSFKKRSPLDRRDFIFKENK